MAREVIFEGSSLTISVIDNRLIAFRLSNDKHLFETYALSQLAEGMSIEEAKHKLKREANSITDISINNLKRILSKDSDR